MGAGHDARGVVVAGARRGRPPGVVAWSITGRRAGADGRASSSPTAGPASASSGSRSAQAAPTSRSSTSARSPPWTRTAYGGRRASTRTPGRTSCCAPTSSAASAWTSPTRPTRRRTGWSAAAARRRSSQPSRRGGPVRPLGSVAAWLLRPRTLPASSTRRSPSPPRSALRLVAKKGLNTSWRAATGKNPPANPADPDVSLAEAVMWAALSGTLIGVARMLATRRAAHYYARSTGHLPPQLQKDGQDAVRPPPPSPDRRGPSRHPSPARARRSLSSERRLNRPLSTPVRLLDLGRTRRPAPRCRCSWSRPLAGESLSDSRRICRWSVRARPGRLPVSL